MTRLVVLQSNYVPWRGYFDLLASADVFVVYDSVQYTKNDWRNRNRLVTEQGPIWLTIPVVTAGRLTQRIRDAEIVDRRWAARHWKTLTQVLGRRPHFERYADEWRRWYGDAADLGHLHDVNLLFLRGLAGQFGITTPLVDDTEFELTGASPTARLVELCRATGATRYLTGPAAAGYLQVDAFTAAGIVVEVIEYDHYVPYPQGTGAFDGRVSVLDLLASAGPDASAHLLGRTHPWA